MKRSRSPVKAHPTERHTKLRVVAHNQDSSTVQSTISDLEQDIAALQKEVERRDVVLQKARDVSTKKQQELDKDIEQNWVPKAVTDVQAKHDHTYRLLRQMSFQLMRCQRQLKIPASLSFVNHELDGCSPNKINAKVGNVSAMLLQELLVSKEAHERVVAELNERVAFLEGGLADLENGRAQLVSGSGGEYDKKESGHRSSSIDLESYEQDVAKLKERVAFLESRLANSENERVQLESGSECGYDENGTGFGSSSVDLENDSGRDNEDVSTFGSTTSLSQFPAKEAKTDAPDIGESKNSLSMTLVNESYPHVPPPSVYPLRFPPDAADVKWFKEAFDFLNIDLGNSFAMLVDRWCDLESLNGWKTSKHALPSVNRPQEVSKWIRYGRYARTTIAIPPSQIDEFAERMWLWWVHLQPEWRKLGKDRRHIPVEHFGDDWKTLDVHGINGWLSLLAGLKWWGESLAQEMSLERNGRGHVWLELIEDMSKMLLGLITYKRKKM